eukprot:553300-Hanusia_phi.AAC.1
MSRVESWRRRPHDEFFQVVLSARSVTCPGPDLPRAMTFAPRHRHRSCHSGLAEALRVFLSFIVILGALGDFA